MIKSILFLIACGSLSTDYKLGEVDSDPPDVEVVETDAPQETDPPIDTSVTPVDTGDGPVTPTGLVGGVLRFTRLDVPCQECFYEYTSNTRVSSVLVLHQPSNHSWNEWIPPTGTCTGYLSQNDPASQFYNVGTSVEITEGTQELSLFRAYNQGQPEYRMESSYPNDFSLYSLYDLSVPQNNTLGDFFIEGALHTPDQIFLLSPTEILNTFYTAFPPAIRRGGTTIAWEPDGDGLFFVIVDVYDSYGYYYLGGTLCVGEDNGSMLVTGLSSYPAGSLLAVYLYRYETTETMIPSNGSTLEGVGQVGLVGTATLAN
ncbi:MAG: hypothetical protein EB127_23565 [Alphaproteobacteria bacterium]|nr:hypothetical protein [Alphaproteobacteria bacterium]